MRLRSRFENLLKERVTEFLPGALETIWDNIGVTVAIEVLKFTSTGGIETDNNGNEWRLMTNFEGFLRVNLLSDNIDQFIVEPLTANLVSNPPFLQTDPDTQIHEISEKARGILIEMRDTIHEQQVASQLRFSVHGHLVKRLDKSNIPDALISQCPEIGAVHKEDYVPISKGMVR